MPDAWEGTAGDLLKTISPTTPNGRPPHGWPTIPRMLVARLKRLTPALRYVGLNVAMPQRSKHGRLIRIERVGVAAAPSAPSAPRPEKGGDDGETPSAPKAVHRHPSAPAEPDLPNEGDDGDDGDDQSPTNSLDGEVLQ